jgi:hypothetical protein
MDRNAAHAAFTIVREEGISTLYRGVTLTALRQATNQGKSNFSPLPHLPLALALARTQANMTRSQFHCISEIQEMGNGLSTRLCRKGGFTKLANNDHGSCFRCHGSILECSYRYDQNVSASQRHQSVDTLDTRGRN